MTLPPFISQNFGAKLIQRVQGAYQSAIQFALIWQLLVYLLLAVSAGWVAQLFSDDPDVLRWLTLWILIVPLGFGFQATTFLSSSTFNALHQPLRAMRVSLVRLFLLYVPLGWLGNHLFELKGMFVALVCANALTALFAWFWMIRFQRRLAESTQK
jgi:Na+-driven multidrug efflux pump